MKKMIGCLALCGAVAVFGEVPEVSNVTISQEPLTRRVTVGYTLSAPGIVTMDILTNGVSIGMEHVRSVTGDMNRLLPAGDHVAHWQPNRDWPDMKIPEAILSAQVTAWDQTTPPDYCTVSMKTGQSMFYACADALPGGVTSTVYRTEQMLMRRIPAAGATFTMGDSPADIVVLGTSISSLGYTGAHQVSFSNDFYIGVFEFTQGYLKQLVPGYNPSHFVDDLHPVEKIAYDSIRGSMRGGTDWPTTGNAIGMDDRGNPPVCRYMRTLTGTEGWDLPTEAQWEFACRAGTTTSLHNGKTITTAGQEAVDIAWYNLETGTQPVGLKAPNAWGLYDMCGNVWEWARDWCRSDSAAGVLAYDAIDPVGEASGTCRTIRGGSWHNSYNNIRSASRYNGITPDKKDNNEIGFRLMCSVEAICGQ